MLEGLETIVNMELDQDIDCSMEAILGLELEIAQLEVGYTQAIRDLQATQTACGNIVSVEAAIVEFGITEELKAIIGEELEANGIILTSSEEALEGTKALASKAWEKVKEIVGKIIEFFKSMWQKIKNLFKAKDKKLKEDIAKVVEEMKEDPAKVSEKQKAAISKEITVHVPEGEIAKSALTSQVIITTGNALLSYYGDVASVKAESTDKQLKDMHQKYDRKGLVRAETKSTPKLRLALTDPKKIKLGDISKLAATTIDLAKAILVNCETIASIQEKTGPAVTKSAEHIKSVANTYGVEKGKGSSKIDSGTEFDLPQIAITLSDVPLAYSKLVNAYQDAGLHIINAIK